MEDAVGVQVTEDQVAPVLPERGLVFSEVKYMQLQLCKPKLLPIKSYSLEKLEKMEKKLAQEAKEKREHDRAQRQATVGWTSPDLLQPSSPPPPLPKAPQINTAVHPQPSPAGPASPLPLAPAKAAGTPKSVAGDDTARGSLAPTTGAAAEGRAKGAMGSPLPLARRDASPASASGLALTEEEAGADAPMSPQDRTSSDRSASAVSASSHSSTGYE